MKSRFARPDRPPTVPRRRVLFVGAVGNDAHAAAQLQVFKEDELDTGHLLMLDDIHTGLSAVWVDGPLRGQPDHELTRREQPGDGESAGARTGGRRRGCS